MICAPVGTTRPGADTRLSVAFCRFSSRNKQPAPVVHLFQDNTSMFGHDCLEQPQPRWALFLLALQPCWPGADFFATSMMGSLVGACSDLPTCFARSCLSVCVRVCACAGEPVGGSTTKRTVDLRTSVVFCCLVYTAFGLFLRKRRSSATKKKSIC